MSKFYSLTISDIHRETPDAVSIAFKVPEQLRAVFAYKPGQYLTIRTHLNGEEVRRSYSICSAHNEPELRVAIKQVANGAFSTYANTQLKIGDALEVMPPDGRFVAQVAPDSAKLYVAFAAGSGITPVMSMIKSAMLGASNIRFILFYGNRGFDDVIFRETLDLLKNQYPDRLSVHHIWSREMVAGPLFYGHLNAEKCAAFGKIFFEVGEVDDFFLCGPEAMIFSIKEALEKMGAAPHAIHFELFTTPGATKTGKTSQTETKEESSFESAITIIQDGVPFDFVLPSTGTSLLDAATRAGADLPYSCKGGVCSTCRAKVLEGEVAMDVCYGLEPDEVADGYILTCQSHPRSKKLVVTFDA